MKGKIPNSYDEVNQKIDYIMQNLPKLKDELINNKDDVKKLYEILKNIRKQSYYNFIKNNLRINPHSLRYAFINYMISKGLEPEKLVVYMGYSSFKHMINYYRVAAAKDQIIKEILRYFHS